MIFEDKNTKFGTHPQLLNA